MIATIELPKTGFDYNEEGVLYVTTEDLHIKNAPLHNLPYSYRVVCTRSGGWELWEIGSYGEESRVIAGENGGPGMGLLLTVGKTVIFNSLNREGNERIPEGEK